MKSTFAFLSFLSFIIMIIGLIKPTIFQKLFKNQKISKWKIFSFSIIVIIFFLVLSSIDYGVNEKQSNNKNTSVAVESVSYEIIKEEDISRKAMGNKSLSDFTSSELATLPTNKKFRYQVLIPTIKNNQIESTVNKIIEGITSNDRDVDEVILWLYSDKELITSKGGYDIGAAIWAPLGILDSVTPEIAISNNRSNYKITIDVRNDLDRYLEQRNKEETVFGLTEQERKQFYKDLVAVEDRARAEADKAFPDYNQNNQNKFRELRQKYIIPVLERYKINSDQEKKISSEGLKEGWPLE